MKRIDWVRPALLACLVVVALATTASAQDLGTTIKRGDARFEPNPLGPGGACCLGDATCLDAVTQAVCDTLDGMYQGDGSTCAAITCVPFGACCFPNAMCEEFEEAACIAAGGNYQGDAMACQLGLCPVTGACCLPDGSCSIQTSPNCSAAGGVYHGFQSTCAAVVCEGACSFDDGRCIDGLRDDQCVGSGGNFIGNGTSCVDVPSPQIAQCVNTSFNQNNSMTLTVDQFDDLVGTRVLQKVSVELDAEIVAIVTLTNLALVPKDNTDVFVNENVTMIFPFPAPANFVLSPIDIIDLVIDCGFSLPPGAMCDFDSPLTYPGTAMGMTTDPTRLAAFTGGGTLDADVTGVGSFEFFGSKFELENNPHLVQAKLRVVYEYIVPGACCFDDGSCVDADTEQACLDLGGVFQGVGTACADDPCDAPACCLPDGTCVLEMAPECLALGGEPQGPGTNCGTVECPTACCLADGTCVFVDPTNCAFQGGTSKPGACADVECETACCLDDGTCVFVLPIDCLGTSKLGSCADVECETACCLPDGTCVFVTPTDCTAQGGDSQLGSCMDVDCPQACCFEDGTCFDLIEFVCTAQGGVSLPGSCADVECDQPCCLPDGTCVVTSITDCEAQSGVPQGVGIPCMDIVCPDEEACCFIDGSCLDLLPEVCTAMGGDPQGIGTECATTDCPDQPGRVGCTEKGSLLIFSKVELRWNNDGSEFKQDTFISLTNDYPGAVKVQLYFVNGDPPAAAGELGPNERAHPGWNFVDNAFVLTANQPVYWSASTGQPQGVSPFEVLDPGPANQPGRPALDGTGDRVLRGYIVGWAINSSGDEIKWNHLTGTGSIVNYGGGSGWDYNACAFKVVDLFGHGEATGTPGILNLDGTEYVQGFEELLVNFQAPGSVGWSTPPGAVPARTVTSDTELTLHPLSADLRQTNDGPVTTKASVLIWNQNEQQFSGTHRCITCWDSTLLSLFTDGGVQNSFLRMFLGTDHGKARITGLAAPVQCDQDGAVSQMASLIGLSARLLSITPDQQAAAGTNLHGLGFKNAIIKYDPNEPPAEATLPPNPTREDVERFIGDVLERYQKEGTGTQR